MLAVGNCHVFDGSFMAWYVWVGWERREGERRREEGGREGGRMRQGMGDRGRGVEMGRYKLLCSTVMSYKFHKYLKKSGV